MVITKRQQKIIIFTAVFILALAVFIVFIYMPANTRLNELKQKYNAIQTEMSEFKKTISSDKPLEQVIIAYRNKIEALGKKFPEKEEIIFKELSNLAQNMEVELTTMNPSKKQIVGGGSGSQAPLIKDCIVQEMTISLSLKSTYKRLGDFLKAMKETFPIFVTIENVGMSKAGDKDSALLNITISITAYLISPKPAPEPGQA